MTVSFAVVCFSGRVIAAPEERYATVANQATAEAQALRAEWRKEALQAAIGKYEEALASWRILGNRPKQAQTLKMIGDVFSITSEYQRSLDYYNQSLVLTGGHNDDKLKAEILNSMSYACLSLGQFQRALAYSQKALSANRRGGSREVEGRALTNIGTVSYFMSDFPKAFAYLSRAAALCETEGDYSGQARALTVLSWVQVDRGQRLEAFRSLESALALARSAKDRQVEASVLTATGSQLIFVGDYQGAVENHYSALSIFETIGDRKGQADAVNNLGYAYFTLGDLDKALDDYHRAADIYRQIANQYYEGTAIANTGDVHALLGDKKTALEEYEHSLVLIRAAHDRQWEALILHSAAAVYDDLRDHLKALIYYQRALERFRDLGNRRWEGNTINGMGLSYEGLGKPQEALKSFRQAFTLGRTAADLSGQSMALYNIARIQARLGDLPDARIQIEAALSINEQLRDRVLNAQSRTAYSASVHRQYELYVDVLMRLNKKAGGGFEATALQVSERARARSLLDTLSEARANIRQGVDPALLERELALQKELNAKAEQRVSLLSGPHTEAETQALEEAIRKISTEYDELEGQIRAKSPRYAALTQPQPLSLKEIQQKILDNDSLLLEYMLGDERSYLWAVTRTEVSTYELPPRAQIEEGAQKFHKLLTANQPVAGESFEQRQARIKEADANISEAAASFSRMVLGPVGDKLGTRRLLIVPDGVLQYIPFQALTVPRKTSAAIGPANAPGESGEQIPLIVDHEIVNEPSASVLALVLSDTSQRQPAPKSIAVFANPVFGLDDARVKSTAGAQGQTTKSNDTARVRETFRDIGFGEGRIPALPASQDEAEAIMEAVPSGTGFIALGFDANRAAITKPELARYRIVHFATHGFIDYQHPELSGLVLSLFDQNGRPQEGFVRLHDIYNLKLSADLVVLSACETGLGKDVKGEGLIGLTRGFMYAGAGGVTASLWKVDDDATAELMKHFYEGMFQRGLTPAAALREAQLGMWKQKRWHAPYFWAAFVLQGQYDQQEMTGFHRSTGRSWAIAAGIGTTLLLLAFLLLRRRRKRIL